MSSTLRFRIGSKFGIIFHMRMPEGAIVTSRAGIAEGTVSEWASIGVRSILKDHWQDKAGRWRDSVYFYELAPGDAENKILCDEFYVKGWFDVVRHETDANRANDAWKDFTPR